LNFLLHCVNKVTGYFNFHINNLKLSNNKIRSNFLGWAEREQLFLLGLQFNMPNEWELGYYRLTI
jgi:hypothetical protein